MRFVRLCEVLCEAPDTGDASLMLVATEGDPAQGSLLEVAVAVGDETMSGYVDPDGADELARHLSAWAAKRRAG